jgi:hypothetical protein
MGLVISFFPRATFAGGTASVDFYSHAYELESASAITVEFAVYGITGGGTVFVQFQESSDPALDPNSWRDILVVPLQLSAVNRQKPGVLTNLLRFVRGKMTMPIGTYATLHVLGVARASF